MGEVAQNLSGFVHRHLNALNPEARRDDQSVERMPTLNAQAFPNPDASSGSHQHSPAPPAAAAKILDVSPPRPHCAQSAHLPLRAQVTAISK